MFSCLNIGATAREDKLNAANRSIVNNFQADLAAKIGKLCNTVVASLDQQNEHLQSVEKLCRSSLDFHDKVPMLIKSFRNLQNSLF